MRRSATLAALFAALLGSSAMAATIVVTEPSEVLIFTNQNILTDPATTFFSDPFANDVWLRRNLANHGAVGLTNNYARSGNGSAWMWGPSFLGNNAIVSSKADMEYYFSDTTGKTLGNLTAFSFDFYRASSSTASVWLHPSLRLFYDADGNLGTTTDRGYLIYERANQPAYGVDPIPEDVWHTDDTFAARFWRTQTSLANDFTPRTLTDHMSGAIASGYTPLSSSSLVLGISAGIGRGWGPWYGAVDNITIGFGGVDTTWNFEVPSDPITVNTATVGSGPGAVTATFEDVDGGELTVVQGLATNADLADPNNPFGAGAAANFAIPGSGSTIQVWNISLLGGTYDGLINLVLTYDDTGMTLAEEEALAIYHFEGGNWVELVTSVNTTLNQVSAYTSSLSPFALGVGTGIPEPASLALLALGGSVLLRRLR